ncbi:MAG: hypothetical protein OEY63_06510, partial [Gemmatimonadota bacterium]|nr:hypothetical protein [Gemmatimonadota bacterium]
LQTDLSHSIGFAQASSGVGNSYSKWRLHPIAATGRSYSLNLSGRYTSNTRRRTDPLPAPGVTARGQLVFGLGGTFSYPTDLESETGTAITMPTPSPEFVAGRLDARGVLAISDARLQARVLLGGAIKDVLLPNGYQTSLGGRGSAPGLDPLPVGKQTASPPGGSSRLDCGARENFYISPSARQSYYPFHGCDRFALFQIQIEGYVGLRFGPDNLALNDPVLGLMIEPVPRWIVFADAAQGWALGDSGTVLRRDEAMAYDVGAGIAFGDLGLFVAKPFSDRGDSGARFIIRLGNRI